MSSYCVRSLRSVFVTGRTDITHERSNEKSATFL